MRSTLMILGLMVFVGLCAGSLQAANAPDEGRHRLFDRIDTNHDGFIELSEWEAFRAQRYQHREAGGAGGAGGGPGVNTHLTMQTASHGGGSWTPGTAGTGPTPSSAPLPPVHPNGNPGNHEDRHPLFDKIDTNHDGKLSLEEWVAYWSAHPRGHKKPAPAP